LSIALDLCRQHKRGQWATACFPLVACEAVYPPE
jgi:hypothetical protein